MSNKLRVAGTAPLLSMASRVGQEITPPGEGGAADLESPPGATSARGPHRRPAEPGAEGDEPGPDAWSDGPTHRSATGNRDAGGRALRRAVLTYCWSGPACPPGSRSPRSGFAGSGLRHQLLSMLLDQGFDSTGLDHECTSLDLTPLPVCGSLFPLATTTIAEC